MQPSERWTSYEDWDFDGLKERLEQFMTKVNKAALLEHATAVLGQASHMSNQFSAGQNWCCFEIVSEDGGLLIARVRLPHPLKAEQQIDEASEQYAINCEVATMRFLHDQATKIPIPKLFAYEPPGSYQASVVGASYMLIEGFYGNTLQDVAFDICGLPPVDREHVIQQWTAVQAELCSLTFLMIGSIASYSPTDGPEIGKLAVASAELYQAPGPFIRAYDFFLATAEARFAEARLQASHSPPSGLNSDLDNEDESLRLLGPFIFLMLVQDTNIFADPDNDGPFALNHMDLGSQNILVDDKLDFVAVIDWEFAQTAPAQVNHYPMPFPLYDSDTSTAAILQDSKHIAHQNVVAQEDTRKLYREKMLDAEQDLARQGRSLPYSIAKQLDSAAARIFAVAEDLPRATGQRRDRLLEMIRLALGLEGPSAEEYLHNSRVKMDRLYPTS